MSKSTKIIAALGVVAGLGVAALPLTSYAADPTAQVTYSITINDSASFTADAAAKSYELANNAKSKSTEITTLTATSNSAKGVSITATSTNTGATLNGEKTSKTIAYSASALTAGTEGWNLTVATDTGLSGLTSGIIAFGTGTNPVTIYTGSAPISSEDIAITFDAATSTTTAADTYSDVVTYTMTANAANTN